MKLTSLTITPKLGILVGVTLLGLCVAGALAGYLMKQEMLNARTDQVRAIVEVARNMAAGLQKQVEAGQLTKEAAIAEFARRANTMTYDNGGGYLFGNTMDGITVLSPDPKMIGVNRMDVQTNGRFISRELLEGSSPRVQSCWNMTTSSPARTSRPARSATRLRFPASTCMSGPGPISTISTPS